MRRTANEENGVIGVCQSGRNHHFKFIIPKSHRGIALVPFFIHPFVDDIHGNLGEMLEAVRIGLLHRLQNLVLLNDILNVLDRNKRGFLSINDKLALDLAQPVISVTETVWMVAEKIETF